jgi:hypothetical protein
MATALYAPADSLAPGLARALVALGRGVQELPWGGDLRSGVDVAGSDVLVTVAPRPQLGPLAGREPGAGTAAVRDIAERPAAAARSLLQGGGAGKRWIAVIPHLSSLPSAGSGPYGAGGVMLQTVLRVAVIENAATGFCANAIAVGPPAGSLDAEGERICARTRRAGSRRRSMSSRRSCTGWPATPRRHSMARPSSSTAASR